jgi:carboxyl-terminal processing protease
MRSDDDKTQNGSGAPEEGQPEGWTPANAPEGWTPPASGAGPWAPPASGAGPWTPPVPPEGGPQSEPPNAAPDWPVNAAPGWPPNAAPGWPPNAAPGWPPNAGWNAAPGWPPNAAPGWPPNAAPGWAPGWPPNPATGWPPAPPAPAQWNPAVGAPAALTRRRARLPQILVVIAACMIAFSGGLVVDHSAFGSTASTSRQPAAATPAGSLQGMDLYTEALQIVRQNFVGRSTLTDQQLLYGSIKGMVDSLGDTGHSAFLTPQEYQAFQNSLNATVAGIGVLITDSNGVLAVAKVIAGSPAAAAGMKAGDQITAVDGASTTGLTIDELGAKIRGTEGTTVKITVVRSGAAEPIDFTLTRAQVSVPLVQWGIVPGTHVADIALIEFSTGASDQLQTAISQAQAAGATSIVLDIRGNPGGYATEAQAVASEFMSSGVVYIEQDANGDLLSVGVDGSKPHTNLPTVVLVDHGSASSSEIVAGALQDSGRAKIVGVATFGTGTVLESFKLSDGSVIFLGTRYWLTPKGHKIFGVGITPDQAVPLGPGVVPVDPTQLGSMTVAQLNSSGDAELLAAVSDLTK